MLTLWLFLAFALFLAVSADYARPYAPLLRPAPVCGCCGARRWQVAA